MKDLIFWEIEVDAEELYLCSIIISLPFNWLPSPTLRGSIVFKSQFFIWIFAKEHKESSVSISYFIYPHVTSILQIVINIQHEFRLLNISGYNWIAGIIPVMRILKLDSFNNHMRNEKDVVEHFLNFIIFFTPCFWILIHTFNYINRKRNPIILIVILILDCPFILLQLFFIWTQPLFISLFLIFSNVYISFYEIFDFAFDKWYFIELFNIVFFDLNLKYYFNISR